MSVEKFRIAVFISGRGSNLKSLILRQKNYEIVTVFSNKSKAGGLGHAKDANIPFHIFDKRDYASIAEQQQAMIRRLRAINPDLICLAGYMQILLPEFIAEFWGKIINIHPSLLPKLQGYFGKKTHEAAIEQKFSTHGCTIHCVDQGLDTGEIIAQAKVEVTAADNADTLAEKVNLKELKIYPWVVNNIASAEIKLDDNKITYSENVKKEAQQQNFIIRH